MGGCCSKRSTPKVYPEEFETKYIFDVFMYLKGQRGEKASVADIDRDCHKPMGITGELKAGWTT